MLSFFRRFFRRQSVRRTKQPLVGSSSDIALVQSTRSRRFPSIRQCFHVGKLLGRGERTILRLGILLGLCGVLWLGYDVFLRSYEEVPAPGGTYTEVLVGGPALLNPLYSSVNEVDADLVQLVYSGLMRRDKEQQLVPDLATAYTVSEDKKTYTFSLRSDVLWHDGQPFTARDVVFTFDMMSNPAALSPLLSSIRGVKIERVDDVTVRFTLAEPFAAFLDVLTVGMLPEHLLGEVRPDRLGIHRLNIQPIGTGPYKVQGFAKDDSGRIGRYELARFDDYYGTQPFISEIVFVFLSGPDAYAEAVDELKKQAVDGVHFIPTEFRDDLSRRFLNVHRVPTPQYTGIFFNQGAKGPQKILSVRTALIQALDKTVIAKEAISTESSVIGSPILPGFPGYGTATQTIVFDREAAQALLDKDWPTITQDEYRTIRRAKLLADWDASFLAQLPSSTEQAAIELAASSTLRAAALAEIDASLERDLKEAQTVYRKNAENEVLEVTLTTVSTHEYEQAARVIAGMWQDVGVITHLQFVEPKDIVRTVLKNRDYEALLYGVIVGADPDQYPFWHSSQALYPGLNLSGYVSERMDSILATIRSTTDDAARATAFTRFETLLYEDRPAAFLYMPPYVFATNSRVQGVDVRGLYRPSDRFAGMNEWYIETKRRWIQ